jgi:hypothetical protein
MSQTMGGPLRAGPGPGRRDALGTRVRRVLLHLAVLAVILVVLRLSPIQLIVEPWFIAVIAGAVALPLLFPARLEELISALTWLALAALAYLSLGSVPFAVVAGVIGLVSLAAAIPALRAREGPIA